MEPSAARKSLRLSGYDYSQNGAYFITVCTENRRPLLSEITVGAHSVRPRLSPTGKIVETSIQSIPTAYPLVVVDKYIIMPNHIHLILLVENTGACDENGRILCAPTISRIIKQYKGYVSKQLGRSIWQKSYYDHIIRNQADYLNKWTYIDTNPAKWAEDEYFAL